KRAREVCPRYCTLAERLAAEPGKLTMEFIKTSHKSVDCTVPSTPSGLRPPNRTLWHALYFPGQRKMPGSFYLRDEADPNQPGKARMVRSDYLEFVLTSAKGIQK